MVGLLPLFAALGIFILAVLQILELRNLKSYLRNFGPHNPKDYFYREKDCSFRKVSHHWLYLKHQTHRRIFKLKKVKDRAATTTT